MNQETLKRFEGRLNLWKAQSRQVTTAELTTLADSEGVALPVVEAIWLKVISRKVHEVRIEVPLVLKETQEGRLAAMTLRLLEPQTTSSLSGKWVCTPDALGEFKVFDGFVQSLENARSAVNALDNTHPIWPEDSPLVVQWEFTSPPCQGIDGGSAGCIVALGVIELFKGAHLIKPEHRLHNTIRSKKVFPFTHLTASAQIDAAGYLLPVEPEGLAAKEQATGMKAMTFLVLSRQQTRTVKMAAAATRQDLPCSNLSEALLKISALLGEETELRVVHPRRWLRMSLAAVSLVGGFWLLGWWLVSYPPFEWVLRWQGLPSGVSVYKDDKPSDCSFIIHTDKTSDYMWITRAWGPLQRIRSSFAMSIGHQTRYRNLRDVVSLAGFGELSGLRSLALIRSEVADLPGAENLHNLERFMNLGSSVRDLRWLNELPNLRTLILDSGFIQLYPSFDFSALETLIIRLPNDHQQLSLTDCSNLRKLAIRADGVAQLYGIDSLPLLEEVVLHLPAVDPHNFNFLPNNKIQKLEIGGCRNLHHLNVGEAFPNLRSLILKNTRFDEISSTHHAIHLESLVIDEDKSLEELDISGMPRLKRLVTKNTALKMLKGLAQCPNLRELILVGVDADLIEHLPEAKELESLEIRGVLNLKRLDLKKWGAMKCLKSLTISETPLTDVVNLKECQQLVKLSILQCPITTLPGVGELISLGEINLSETKLAVLEPLLKLLKLKSLNLSKTQIGDWPKLGSQVTGSLDIESTPLMQKHPGNHGHWIWERNSAPKSGHDMRGWGGLDSYTYVQPNYDYSFDTYTPSYSFGPVYDQYDTLEIEGGQKQKPRFLGPDGWEVESETRPAKPEFDVQALLDQWGLRKQLGEVQYGFSGTYYGEHKTVNPFVKPPSKDARGKASSPKLE